MFSGTHTDTPFLPSLEACDNLLRSQELGLITKQTPTNESLRERLPLEHPSKLQKILEDEQVLAVGELWREKLSAQEEYIPKLLTRHLDDLENSLREKPLSPRKCGQLIEDLCDHLIVGVHEKALASSAGKLPIAGGWEPYAARQVMHWNYGARLRERVQKLLADAVLAKALDTSTRIRAADYLGIVDIGDCRPRFNDLCRVSADNPEILAVLSSVAVRSRFATEDNINHVIERLQAKKATSRVRLICLEAAFLAGLDNKVLQDPARELLSNADFSDFHVGRCVLAATCNDAGKRIILEGCLLRWPSCPPEVVLPLARWALSKSDRTWETLISVSEEIAIDSSRSETERVWAAEIMSVDDSSSATRDIFIREAINKPRSPLFRAALTMIIEDQNAAEYLPSLTSSFPNADLETQQLIAQLLLVALPEPLTDQSIRDLDGFIVQSSRSNDPVVRAAIAALKLRR